MNVNSQRRAGARSPSGFGLQLIAEPSVPSGFKRSRQGEGRHEDWVELRSPWDLNMSTSEAASPLSHSRSSCLIEQTFSGSKPHRQPGQGVSKLHLCWDGFPREEGGPGCWGCRESGSRGKRERLRREEGGMASSPGRHLICNESVHRLSVSGSRLASTAPMLPRSGRMKSALSVLVYGSCTIVQPSASSRK